MTEAEPSGTYQPPPNLPPVGLSTQPDEPLKASKLIVQDNQGQAGASHLHKTTPSGKLLSKFE